MSNEITSRILACGIIPVIRAPTAELAMQAVDAIVAGGIDVVEVTMTVPGAVALIHSLTSRYGDEVVIGAGTVIDAETASECIAAGAAFVVSPIVDEPTIARCRALGAVILPGALTPSEIVHAARAGADLIKVFPCGAVGGASYIRSLKAPLPHLRLVPTGGVSLQNVGDFVRAGASAVGVGADLVDVEKLRSGRTQAVTESATRYLAAIREARAPKSKR
ncbi:MAG: bifunctional 4-hydroxy-2-oxoglutarate aldolase/2-dehydro-3-deoxy-phosphogluconate aldolase [Myxococcota bacterium]|nr:bifunctional 4-hydroxy-2-oxoglutarate aldolase/2-dehydro-3-deoxy-phosphogluconate aldolase [Myxococcota bacterium]